MTQGIWGKNCAYTDLPDHCTDLPDPYTDLIDCCIEIPDHYTNLIPSLTYLITTLTYPIPTPPLGEHVTSPALRGQCWDL